MMLKKVNEILSLFTVQRAELTALDIAEALQKPKSTTYRLLSSIADAGFLDYDESTARYRLGIRLAALGVLAQRSTSLQRQIHPTLLRLSTEVRETVTLMVRDGAIGTTIDMVEAFHGVMVPAVLGGHPPLHASAGGKVLLAWLSQGERRIALRLPLKRFTESTITDVAKLHEDLDRTRDKGYAIARGEWVADVFSVAAPVWNHSAQLVGAITIGVPRARANAERLGALRDAVVRAAAEASIANGLDASRGRSMTPPVMVAEGRAAALVATTSPDRRRRVRR